MLQISTSLLFQHDLHLDFKLTLYVCLHIASIRLKLKCFIPSAEMTVPSVTRDLLMLAPSFNLLPVAPVELALSLRKI